MKCFVTMKGFAIGEFMPIAIEVETQTELNSLLRIAQHAKSLLTYLVANPYRIYPIKEDEAIIDFLIKALLGYETKDDQTGGQV